MISLLRTVTNGTLVETPCEDADIAKSITFQLHNFFHDALRYDLPQCRGMYFLTSVCKVSYIKLQMRFLDTRNH